jgi:protein-S-isoprenylcysteine O-methyltransferase Ste14
MSTPLRIVLTLLVGIVVFVGLPLLGWGLGDVRGFVDDPVRLSYIVLTFALCTFAAIQIPAIGRPRPQGRKTVHRQHHAIALMQALSFAIVLVGPYCDRRNLAVLGPAEVVRYLGLTTFALGFLMMHWIQAHLGKQFSLEVTVQENHRLVTDGPYRYLRHPRYLGIMVFAIGLALLFRSGVALLLAAAMTAVLLWRIHDEEALLSQEFGEEWQAYVRKSWRLIPHIY